MSEAAPTSLATYEEWSPESAEGQQQEVERASRGNFLNKLKVGKTYLRFLPPPTGVKNPFVVTYNHYVEMPGDTQNQSFNCPAKMANQRCRMCEKATALSRSGNPYDEGMAKKLWPRMRVFANVVDMKAPDLGVAVFPFGKKIYDGLVDVRLDEDFGGDFTHPETGFTIVVKRVGTGKNDTEYFVKRLPTEEPLADMSWLEARPELSKLAFVPDDTKVQSVLAMLDPAGAAVQVSGPASARRVGSTAAAGIMEVDED